MSEYHISGTLEVKLIQNKGNLILEPVGWQWENFKDAGVCFMDADYNQCLVSQCIYHNEKKQLEITGCSFEAFSEDINVKWKIYLFYDNAGEKIYKRFYNHTIEKKIHEIEEEFQSQSFRYGESVYDFKKDGIWYCALPYFTINARLGIIIKEKSQMLLPIVKAKVLHCNIEKSQLYITMKVKKKGYVPGRILLQFRGEDIIYPMETQYELKENGSFLVTGQLDLNTVHFRPIYWDTLLCLYEEGQDALPENERIPYYVNAYNGTQKFADQFLRLKQEVAYRTDNGYIFFPFVTRKFTLAFKYREVSKADSIWFRFKERIARKIYEKNPAKWDAKNIYLVYEKFCMCAQDNGFYFFKYCMEHPKQLKDTMNFYYVIDRHSPDYRNVRRYGRKVIPFLSIRHMIYIQAAKLLISTDSKPHSYAWRQKGSILYDEILEKKNVFLQHGVIGLKNITGLYKKGSTAGSNLFVVSSEREKKIVKEELGYNEDEIIVTGLARWDVLKDRSGTRKEILVMPTWRKWLDGISDEQFCKSSYFAYYEQLLINPEMLALLEEKDLYLTFYLHPILRKFIQDFSVENERIRLIPFGEEPLNELLMKSKLIITDYSSVSWDMFYQKKPVIFYQFDVEEYNKEHGSYMDFDRELFGDRVDNIEDLVRVLRENADGNFVLKEQYEKQWKSAFAYVDSDNSKRILEEILKWK